ncbi:MAG: hypothetical protein ACFFCT_13735 [Candidatus Odinarchaeota archaeon]
MIVEKQAKRGSQKWIQIAVNEKSELLNSVVARALHFKPDEMITWLSPLVQDGYQEYFDQKFIKQLGVKLNRRQLSDFWPKRGLNWDALGKTSKGRVLLVEAKAHIQEMVTSPSKASAKSLIMIKNSLDEVKKYLGVSKDVDWTGWFYQYTNRLAHLYLLRELNDLPAELLFLCFINDYDMDGPTSSSHWDGAIEMMEVYLGLPKNHRLSRYVHHLYLDVQKLAQ